MKWILLNTLLLILLICLLAITISQPNAPYRWVLITLEGTLIVGIWMIARRIRRGVS